MTPPSFHRALRWALRAPACAGGHRALVAALFATVLGAGAVRAQTQLPTGFVDQLIVQNLQEPVGMAFLPDERLLVLERGGNVRLVTEGKLGAVDPMLSLPDNDPSGDRGASGIAIDPRWPGKPYVYLYYSSTDGHCKLERYTAGGDLDLSSSLYLTLDPATRYEIIGDIPDLQNVHNGGTVRFGPDSMLYAALGDDGDACAAQDSVSLRGVVVRIDVRGLPDGPGGPANKALLAPADNPLAASPNLNERLVWATGLRNPFRFQFDSATGDMFIGDVGFNLFEEIDVLHGPLHNFGWPYYEGPAPYQSSCPGVPLATTLDAPIYAYDRTGFTAAIMGGPVYHAGSACPSCGFPAEYEGSYFCSDFYEGFLRRLEFDGTSWHLAPAVAGQSNGEDWGEGFQEVAEYLVGHDGAMWYCQMGHDFNDGTGEIHRIYYSGSTASVGGPARPALALAAPFPSPSRGRVDLSYTLPSPGVATLELLDAQGRSVRRLVPAVEQGAGMHRIVWDGSDAAGRPVSPGVYLARLDAAGHTTARRLVICR